MIRFCVVMLSFLLLINLANWLHISLNFRNEEYRRRNNSNRITGKKSIEHNHIYSLNRIQTRYECIDKESTHLIYHSYVHLFITDIETNSLENPYETDNFINKHLEKSNNENRRKVHNTCEPFQELQLKMVQTKIERRNIK